MTMTKRYFLVASLSVSGLAVFSPALWGESFFIAQNENKIEVTPIHHASFVLKRGDDVIFVDPVGDPALYSAFEKPSLILITHEHGDHYAPETLEVLSGEETDIIADPAVVDMMPASVPRQSIQAMKNGEDLMWQDIKIEAIPAYNITEDRLNYHPKGRDNGYVLNIGEQRIYISGDTEDTEEMRALENIDFAFLCMNLPFTMTAEQAASAVKDFKPKEVTPYHYQGRDGGTQDPESFKDMVGDTSKVVIYDWYAEDQ